MKNSYLYTILFTFCIFSNAYGQKADFSDLEKKIQASIQKGYDASVRIWGFDTVRIAQSSSQFSGVVISSDGHILTVAHAIQPKQTYKVLFPDGREVLAVALGRIGLREMQNRPDMGMLKILDQGIWPVAEMAWSYSLKVNEPCISISYPETLNQRFPTVRFGRIADVLNQRGFIQSTCKMELGDSGGPLFDYMGRVIGMHSRCNPSEDENFEVPIDLYRKYWSALTVPEDYKSLPENTEEIGTDPMADQIISLPFLSDLSVGFAKLINKLENFCVPINSLKNGVEQKALGTVVVVKGKYYVLSKSSLVYADATVSLEGKTLKTTVIDRDNENDLVLLRLDGKLKGGIPLNAFTKTVDLHMEHLGNFLISPLPNDPKISVLGSRYFDQPRKFSAGYLGAPARFVEGKITISNILSNSPAALVDLKVGDQITGINGVAVNLPPDYGGELIKYNPGDTISIQGIRDGNDFEVSVVLHDRPTGTHTADRFDGGKSVRLDGFAKVFAHDPVLRPDECGSPVFNNAGHFYGMNIARFSRTSTLVMPADVLGTFIRKALNI